MRGGAGLLFALVLGAAGAAPAQQGPDSARARTPRLTIELRRDSALAPAAPLVRVEGQVIDAVFEGALRTGFPVRLAFRLGLWRSGRFVDRLEREVTWEAVVVLDPLTATYELLRSGGSVETFGDPARLAGALATPFTVDLVPPRPPTGTRWYYVADLAIESLSLSELEEVERWLRGDLGRAIRERGDLGDALGRGARLMMIRLSGLPHRSLEARTPAFRY